MRLALLIAAIAMVPPSAVAQWRTPWSYEGAKGPEHWGDLDPEYAACKTGKEQSPVDIRKTEKADLPALRFDYTSSPLQYLINNGYAIRVNYHAPVSGGFLIVGDKRYQLTQFHFHRPKASRDFPRSSNGRTAAFGAVNRGSNPCLASATVLLIVFPKGRALQDAMSTKVVSMDTGKNSSSVASISRTRSALVTSSTAQG